MIVPNQPPVDDPGALRLAIVAEAPALEEVSQRTCPRGHRYAGEAWEDGRHVERPYCPDCGSSDWVPTPTPLVGPSGRMLDWLLREAGLPRSRVWVGNVCQQMAQAAVLEDPTDPAMVAGLAALTPELAAFRPNVVLCLGNTALRAMHPWGWSRNEKREFRAKITDWRGSVFAGCAERPWKCVAAYHPAACLRQPEWGPMLRFDLARAVAEAASPALNLPERNVEMPTTADALLSSFETLRGKRLGFDIEGYPGTGVTDCSFADTPNHALWVPFRRADGSPWWSPSDEQRVRLGVASLLEDEGTPKVMHNAMYELFALRWGHQVHLRGIGGDTMLLWHEAYCELDKALEVAASVMTRQTYWKFGRGAVTEDERALYNCTDSMVTLELEAALLAPGVLTPGQLAHYHHRLALLEPTCWQMMHGFRFDDEARRELVRGLWAEVYALQGELDEAAGIEAPTLDDVRAIVCNKNKADKVTTWADVPTFANKRWREAMP